MITSDWTNKLTLTYIDWWVTFLPSWNGTSCILETEWSTSTSISIVYWLNRMESTLVWYIDTNLVIIWRRKKEYSKERTFCHHSSSQHLGIPLCMHKKGFILCRQPGYCGYLENREYQVCRYDCPNLHAIFVQLDILLILSLLTLQVLT